MSNPGARCAATCPTRPMPTTPKRFPVTWEPSMNMGLQSRQRSSRTMRYPSPARRAAPSMQSIAISAVASERTSGVLVTMMPFCPAGLQVAMVHTNGKIGDGANIVGQPPDQAGIKPLRVTTQNGIRIRGTRNQLTGGIEHVVVVEITSVVPGKACFATAGGSLRVTRIDGDWL